MLIQIHFPWPMQYQYEKAVTQCYATKNKKQHWKKTIIGKRRGGGRTWCVKVTNRLIT